MYLLAHSRAALADFARGLGITLPTEWWVGLATGLDSNEEPEEIVDSTYFRVSIDRSLTAWSGTQGEGTTTASTGTSHVTSNNVTIDWGSLSGSWGVATHVVIFDNETAGNAWFALPISALNLQSGSPASLQPGALRLTFGIASGVSNYLANSLIDLLMRDQAWSWPSIAYIGYTLTDSTNATPGTEPSTGTGYGREPVDADDVAWLHDGNGIITNAAAIEFNQATLAQGDVVGHIYMDSASGGNMLFYGDMSNGPVSIQASEDPPQFQAGALEYFFA